MPAATFGELLVGKTPNEKAALKAQGLAAIMNDGEFTVGNKTVTLAKLVGYDYTLNGVTITLTGASFDGVTLIVNCTASDANGPLPASTANAHRFVNPPLMVWIRAPGTNGESDPGEATENVITTAKQWLYDSVVTYAENHGWTLG